LASLVGALSRSSRSLRPKTYLDGEDLGDGADREQLDEGGEAHEGVLGLAEGIGHVAVLAGGQVDVEDLRGHELDAR
jgi:hypothetical protein